MKVFPIKFYNPNIKGKDDINIFGYDDSVSQERRQYIRNHYEREIMPYQSIYEKEPRLEEFQLNKLLNFLVNRPPKVDGETILSLPLSNLHRISSSRRYQPQIYRGSTLYDSPDWVINKLRDAGIKTVINVGDYVKSYKEKIEKFGLNYVDFCISELRYSAADDTYKKNKLINFIKTMQQEYVYLGCECGTYKTDAAILLNTLFNPKVKGYCKIFSPEFISDIPEIADNLYICMTDNDKMAIGWTREFEEIFNSKIAKMLRY